MFELRASKRATMDHRTGMERAICELLRIILRSPILFNTNMVEEEAGTQAEIIRKVTQQLEHISKMVGQDRIATWLKRILENKAITEALK